MNSMVLELPAILVLGAVALYALWTRREELARDEIWVRFYHQGHLQMLCKAKVWVRYRRGKAIVTEAQCTVDKYFRCDGITLALAEFPEFEVALPDVTPFTTIGQSNITLTPQPGNDCILELK